MLTAIVPLFMIILGALGYALSTNAKLQELGRILFAAGAFALAFSFSRNTLTL